MGLVQVKEKGFRFVDTPVGTVFVEGGKAYMKIPECRECVAHPAHENKNAVWLETGTLWRFAAEDTVYPPVNLHFKVSKG